MNRIVYLSFYFKPDLSAGSFRNSSLVLELAKQADLKNYIIEVYTTMPNRYSSFEASAQEYEKFDNVIIHRISLPLHKSGMLDQIVSYWTYYKSVIKLNYNKKNSLVFASSSRLFTAYLGYKIAKKSKSILYLDIRDIFLDTMDNILKSRIQKAFIIPFLKYFEFKTFKNANHINLISGGFGDYFKKYKNPKYSFFPNGIDDDFLHEKFNSCFKQNQSSFKTIVYAGNIGEGQGLHKIVPSAAKLLGAKFHFLIIGDGGSKHLLINEIKRLGLNNVTLKNPVPRADLIEIYQKSDFLFLHLNDYPAFRKVLPSKIFELATFDKEILAGVAGFSAKFIKDEVSNSFVFEPCDVEALVEYLSSFKFSNIEQRIEFINKYKRSEINKNISESILSYL